MELMVVAGSYEQVVLGYKVLRDGAAWRCAEDFTQHSHTSSVSAAAASRSFIATGSKDESIKLYDMDKRSEIGALLHHEGTITCLQFYGESHLLSGSEDGLMCVWSTKSWECLKSIKAHKGHVSSLSVHPSGKLALSVGTDKTLRTWNLIDGRSAFIKNIKMNAHIVRWSPDGDQYVVVMRDRVDVYSLQTACVTNSITNPSRVSSVCFLSNSVIALAGDDECVRLYNAHSQRCVCEFKAHVNRVKALQSFTLDDFCVLVSASNDGFIRLWKLNMDQLSDSPSLLTQVDTTARLTCVTVWKPPQQRTHHTPQASGSALPLPAQRKRVRIGPEEVIIEDSNADKGKTCAKKKKSSI